MNVLLIAPDVGLPAAASEVRAVSLALNATLLNGTVTRRDVLDTLSVKPWDIIWFATHGDEHGIRLSDAPLLAGDLAAIVRNTPAKLLVLNTCSSRNVARDIHYDLDRKINIICTQADADDPTAYQTGALLARNLSQGLSVHDAYERSRPGNDTLYYLFPEANGKAAKERDEQLDEIFEVFRGEILKVYRAINDSEKRVLYQVGELRKEVMEELDQLRLEISQRDKTHEETARKVYAMEYAGTRTRLTDTALLTVVTLIMILLLTIYIVNQLGIL